MLQDGGSTILACQMIRYDKRFSGYWFAPRGPVADRSVENPREAFRTLLEELLKQKLPGSTLFYRFEPPVTIEQARGMMPMRMRRTHALNPASTILVDLTRSEDELMAAMHEKTRYNVRLAAKKGVTVREGRSTEDTEAFLRLLSETGARQGFTPQAASYVRATHAFLAPLGMSRIRLAEHEGQVLAANLEIVFGDTVTYLHGASSSEHRELMAPYLLHWEAIRVAKAYGKNYYDLWGCNPESQASYYYKPSWEGITRFKRGIGGQQVDLVGTWDLPVNRVLYRLAFPGGILRG